MPLLIKDGVVVWCCSLPLLNIAYHSVKSVVDLITRGETCVVCISLKHIMLDIYKQCNLIFLLLFDANLCPPPPQCPSPRIAHRLVPSLAWTMAFSWSFPCQVSGNGRQATWITQRRHFLTGWLDESAIPQWEWIHSLIHVMVKCATHREIIP